VPQDEIEAQGPTGWNRGIRHDFPPDIFLRFPESDSQSQSAHGKRQAARKDAGPVCQAKPGSCEEGEGHDESHAKEHDGPRVDVHGTAAWLIVVFECKFARGG